MAVYIQTHSGRMVNLERPRPEDIIIGDIAKGLSKICRFAGNSKQFYSVAQHSVLVSMRCYSDPLAGLLHDAAEIFTGDIPAPFKGAIKDLPFVENLNRVIGAKFGVDLLNPHRELKAADEYMLAWEKQDLMSEPTIGWGDRLPRVIENQTLHGLGPEDAEELFIDRWMELTANQIHQGK